MERRRESTEKRGKRMIEDVVLRYSKRGMTVLREYLRKDYCRAAAEALLEKPCGAVFLATGFYVGGFAETDGPVGTFFLAGALKKLGFTPVIVTDRFCAGFFDGSGFEICCMETEAGTQEYEKLLERFLPVALISIERCGRNRENDYANMRGASIAEHTAKIDLLFESAAARGILTIGVGDGGNEIGMGNLADVIDEKLSLTPCTVPVSHLVIATVSNWGAYALAAYLQREAGRRRGSRENEAQSLLPDFAEVEAYLKHIVALGSVDGLTREHTATVDGFSLETEREIVEALREEVRAEKVHAVQR